MPESSTYDRSLFRGSLRFKRGDERYTISTDIDGCRNAIGAMFLFDIDNDGIEDIVFKEHSGRDIKDRLLVLHGEPE